MTTQVNHSTSFTIRTHRVTEAYDDTLNWIYNKKSEIEGCKYGRNRASLEQGLQDQQKRAKEILDYRSEVDKTIQRISDKDKQENLQKAYDELKEVSDRKLNCLATMLEITSLEEHCSRLSRQFDTTSVGLVHPTTREAAAQTSGNIQGFISPSSQDCVFGVQDNWEWIVKLVACVNVHLKNGSDYHQFFHEVDETAPWMIQDLEKIQKTFDSSPLTGEYIDAQKLMKEIESITLSLKQWEAKSDHLWEKANKVVPVHMRVDAVSKATPARALCDYSTKEVSFRSGEDILLLDNSRADTWRVRTCRGEEGDVIAPAVLIPGPYKLAVDAAIKLRLQLLTQWTSAIKRLGKRLLCFMLLVFKPEYEMNEIQAIRSIKRLDKQELLRILDHVEDTLRSHWSDHEGFINLQERILALRMILEEVGGAVPCDEKLMNALVVQITSLEKLMTQYKDMFGNWEMYKTSVEASQNPDLMLVVDKWQQLQFVTKDFFSKFWKHELPMNQDERSLMTLRTMTVQGEKIEDPAHEETETLNTSWNETKVKDVRYVTERELNRAKKVDLNAALGTTETFDSGFQDTHVVERRVTMETERPVHRARMLKIEDALGGGDLNKMSDVTTHVTETRVTSDRPLNRSRQVDISVALGGAPISDEGSSESGFSETRISEARYGMSSIDGALIGSSTGDYDNGFGSGYTETRVTETRYSSADRLGMNSGSSEGGFSETRTTETRFGTSGSDTRAMDVETSDVGFDETRVTETRYGLEGQYGIGVTGGSSEDGFSETRTTETRYGAESSASGGGSRQPRLYMAQLSSEGQEVFEEGMFDEGLIESRTEFSDRKASLSETSGSDFGYATMTRTAETEQIQSAEMEEKKTFIIRSVINPYDDHEMSLQEAIVEGFIRPQLGDYYNPRSGETVPIPTAMNRGLIKVAFTTTKRGQEKRSSVGIITVKTIREPLRPYIVLSVIDPDTGSKISQRDAAKRNILHEHRGIYVNTKTGERMLVSDAIERGFVEVEYTGEAPEPEVISKTYAVRAVVDLKMKKVITFSQAVQRGIIDKESGAYKNTLTGETMYVGDAIMRGFLKARPIDRTASMDIDPENKMLVDKTESIRKKVLQPLKVISAFKRAGKVGNGDANNN